MKKRLLVLGAMVVLLMTAVVAEAATYNAATDFSITNGNPNGVWSYGWMPSDFSSYNLFTNSVSIVFNQWYTPGMSYDYTPTVGINLTGSNQYGVSPGQLTLHPGPGGQAATLQFTAPATGNYDINGQFFAGDVGQVSVGIREGSSFIWNSVDSGAFSFQNFSLNAGDQLEFVVYNGYGYGNTPLDLDISTVSSQVPEPGLMLLLSTGLLAVVGCKKFSSCR